MQHVEPGPAALSGLAAVSGLGDRVRGQLYEFVSASPSPVSRDEAAAAAGIGRGLAAYHLDKLVQLGLLTAAYQRLSGRAGRGAGRPAKIYSRSGREFAVSVPPREYELAATLLAQAVEAGGGQSRAALEAAARQRGAELGALYQAGAGQASARGATTPRATTPRATTPQAAAPQAAAPRATTPQAAASQAEAPPTTASRAPAPPAAPRATTPQATTPQAEAPQATTPQAEAPPATARPATARQAAARLAAAEAALREHGFDPWHDQTGTIRLRNCPFQQLATEHPDLTCSMNLAFIEGITAGLGGTGLWPELDPAPGRCCVVIGAGKPTE